MPNSAAKFNVYETVTETIVNAVKAGTLPWQKPWTGGAGLALPLRSCGSDSRAIFGLASKAQAATDWMVARAGTAADISSPGTTSIEDAKAKAA